MKITKEEVLAIVKKNGLNEEQAEQLLEMLAKSGAGVVIDLVELLVNKTETDIDNMIFSAGKSKLIEMKDAIEVSL